MGILLLLYSGLTDVFFSDNSFFNIRTEYIILSLFITGILLLIIEFFFYWHTLKKRFGNYDNIEILRLFRCEWLHIAGLCLLILGGLPVLTIFILYGSYYSLPVLISTLFGFVIMTIGERQMDRMINLKIPQKMTDKKHIVILRDELLALNVCVDMTNYYIDSLRPLGIERELGMMISNRIRKDPTLSVLCTLGNDCKLYKRDLPDKINGLGSQKIIDAFIGMIKTIMNFHGDLVSLHASRYTLENVFRMTRNEYGNPSIFIDLLLALPKGVLEEEKLSVLSQDVLESKVKQRTAYLSQAFLRAKEAIEEKIAIVNAMVDPLIVIGSDHVVKMVNPAFESVFGYPLKDLSDCKLERSNWVSAMDERTRNTLNDVIITALTEGEAGPVELFVPEKNGKMVPVTLTSSVISFEDGEHDVILVFRDISKLKKREKELKLLDHAIESSINAITVVDMENDILYVNQAFLDMFGYDNHRDALNTSFGELVIIDDEFTDALSDIILDPEGWMGEMRCRRRDGEMFDALMVTTLVEDTDGESMAYMVSLLDISDKKAAEAWKNFLHSLLIHDIGNKLQIIQGYIELMLEEGLDEEMENMALKEQESVSGAVGLIKRVQMLSQAETEMGEGSINPYFLLKETINAYKARAAESGIELVTGELEGDIKVRSDSQGGTLIESIFSNLIDNTIKHADCSKIRITSREYTDYVVITIEDDGTGLENDVIQELTRSRTYLDINKNVGLHLSMVSVESIGGHIDISESDLGGVRFDIYLVRRGSES